MKNTIFVIILIIIALIMVAYATQRPCNYARTTNSKTLSKMNIEDIGKKCIKNAITRQNSTLAYLMIGVKLWKESSTLNSEKIFEINKMIENIRDNQRILAELLEEN